MKKEKEAKSNLGKEVQERRKLLSEQEKKEALETQFPYDRAFRTLEGECDDVLLPFINYCFHENYDETAEITRLRNEHIVEHPDHTADTKITDSHLSIRFHGVTKVYQIECESNNYDRTLLIRLFEYHTQTAIDTASRDSSNVGEMTFVFPYAGLLLLRGKESDPKEATIHLVTPEDRISYHVPIIKIIDFSLEEIFEKRLYFLIPFYIFNYEKQFPELERDEKGRRDLVEVYETIFQKLEEEAKCGGLSELSMHVIINITRRIVYNLAKKHPKVQEEVGDFMGGEPYDLEIVRMYREAEAKGMAKGMAQGQAEGESRLVSAIQDLRSGMTREQLLEKYDESTVDLAFVVK